MVDMIQGWAESTRCKLVIGEIGRKERVAWIDMHKDLRSAHNSNPALWTAVYILLNR